MSGGVRVVAPTKIGPYTIRGTVGEGAFSVVKLAYNEELQQYFACKIVPKSRLSSHHLEKRFEVEIRINQQMHHPGIVGLIDILKDDLNYYIMMEFCPNGELFQYIVDRGRLNEDEAAPKVRQILETLQYIHKMRVTHRDLKPENILIDQYGQLKISDFGLSRFADENDLVSTPCGSPCYASPECISGKPYNYETTDVWSVGVILYAMVTGQLPWTKRNQAQLFEQIRRGEYTIPSHVSFKCSDFIRGLMTVDITKRFTIEKALKHPFLVSTPPFEFQSSTPFAKMISIKKVDDYFNFDIDIIKQKTTISTLPRSKSTANQDFDAVLREIQASSPGLKLKRRLVKVKKSEAGERKIVRKASKTDIGDPIRKRTKTEDKKDGDTTEKKQKRTVKTTTSSDLEAKPRATIKRISRPKPIRELPL